MPHPSVGVYNSEILYSWQQMMQLTDWCTISTPNGLNVVITDLNGQIPGILSLTDKTVSRILINFLQDPSRAGKYAVTADTHANASVRCMQYLFRSRLGPPINLHHTPRNLARRRNSPWHWNRYKKFINRLPAVVYGKGRHTTTLPDRSRVDYDGWKQASSMCENLEDQVKRHQHYTSTTRLGIDFLLYTLPLSAPSDELIALLRAEKSFSQRAMELPRRLKKCKAAIATYLARVEPKPEPATSVNERDTVIPNDESELLPVGEEGVLLHDQDLGLAERWWMWVARGKTSGVGAEQADGRWGSLGYILKFLLPIFISFILSVVVSYFS